MPDSFGSNPVGQPVQPCSAAAQTEKHWIEIQLLGEDDSPVPDEEYRITLPNGDQARGYLDSKGCARMRTFRREAIVRLRFRSQIKTLWEPIG